jgi:hypothetical protein
VDTTSRPTPATNPVHPAHRSRSTALPDSSRVIDPIVPGPLAVTCAPAVSRQERAATGSVVAIVDGSRGSWNNLAVRVSSPGTMLNAATANREPVSGPTK